MIFHVVVEVFLAVESLSALMDEEKLFFLGRKIDFLDHRRWICAYLSAFKQRPVILVVTHDVVKFLAAHEAELLDVADGPLVNVYHVIAASGFRVKPPGAHKAWIHVRPLRIESSRTARDVVVEAPAEVSAALRAFSCCSFARFRQARFHVDVG